MNKIFNTQQKKIIRKICKVHIMNLVEFADKKEVLELKGEPVMSLCEDITEQIAIYEELIRYPSRLVRLHKFKVVVTIDRLIKLYYRNRIDTLDVCKIREKLRLLRYVIENQQ